MGLSTLQNIQVMEFPISRTRLQNYKFYEAMYMETKQRVSEKVKFICKNVERVVVSTDERKYVYKITNEDKYGMLRTMKDPVSKVNTVGILKELLEALVKLFPDSKVVIDPLETYILIDWS